MLPPVVKILPIVLVLNVAFKDPPVIIIFVVVIFVSNTLASVTLVVIVCPNTIKLPPTVILPDKVILLQVMVSAYRVPTVNPGVIILPELILVANRVSLMYTFLRIPSPPAIEIAPPTLALVASVVEPIDNPPRRITLPDVAFKLVDVLLNDVIKDAFIPLSSSIVKI